VESDLVLGSDVRARAVGQHHEEILLLFVKEVLRPGTDGERQGCCLSVERHGAARLARLDGQRRDPPQHDGGKQQRANHHSCLLLVVLRAVFLMPTKKSRSWQRT